MAFKWPFGKKSVPPKPIAKPKPIEVVEYERKKDTYQKDLIEDKSHLEKKSFIDAMALLGDD